MLFGLVAAAYFKVGAAAAVDPDLPTVIAPGLAKHAGRVASLLDELHSSPYIQLTIIPPAAV
jgi:hypothetical protein